MVQAHRAQAPSDTGNSYAPDPSHLFGRVSSPSKELKSKHTETAITAPVTSKGWFDHIQQGTGGPSVGKNSGDAEDNNEAQYAGPRTAAKAVSQDSPIERAAAFLAELGAPV